MEFAKLSGAAGKTPPGHFDMRTFGLISPDGDGSKLALSVSHYLPGGGAEYGKQPVEVIFYMLSGELTILSEKGEHPLPAGACVRIAKGEMKGVANKTNEPATMLVIANVDMPPLPPGQN